MVLVFMGAAGSGKDTQAEILAEKYGFEVVSTGQIFRDAAVAGTEESKEVETYTARGDLVPDELVYRMLEKHLAKVDISQVVFTGAVRKLVQVKLMDDVLTKLGTKVDYVVYFELSDEEAIKRIAGRRYSPDGTMYHVEFKPPKVDGIDDLTGQPLVQREDDKPEAIAKRLADFHAHNDAILDVYRQRGVLIEIDAAKDIEAIASEVEQKLGLSK